MRMVNVMILTRKVTLMIIDDNRNFDNEHLKDGLQVQVNVEAVGAPRRLRQAPQAGETVVYCAQFRVVVCALVSGREWLLDCR